MKRIILAFSLAFFAFTALAISNDKPAYKIYNSAGEEIAFSAMVEGLATSDIVFFGELHNNPIAHWLQYEISKVCLEKRNGKLILGAEMFESDNQLLMNEYLDGSISEKSYNKEMRLWNNYSTDYKPLVELAKFNNIPFIATNIPRRYASLIAKQGFEGLDNLSADAKKYIAPLPIKYDPEVACYKKMGQMAGMPAMAGKKMPQMANIPKAQASKDATMSHFIIDALVPGSLFIHFNGSYHSDNHEGIVWYIKQANSKLKVKTITTVMQKDLNSIDDETKKSADFIIVVDENMTGTY